MVKFKKEEQKQKSGERVINAIYIYKDVHEKERREGYL